MATYSLAQFQKLSREDLEKSKFWLTADGKIAIRYILWISSRWPPVETWDDLPVSGTVEWQAVVVYNDTVLGSTIAVWNGTERKQVWWLIEIPCADVKDCIEAFTELDLSEILNLTLGGDIVFDEWTNIDRTNTTNTGIQNFDNLYIANYDGSTFNYSGDVIMNLAEGDSITYNFDGTVNNDFWVTYIENNIYAEGATITYEWSVIHSYNNYTENTIYEENVIYNYEWAVTNNYTEYIEYNNYDETTNIYYDGGNHYYENSTITYDEFSSVTYEWDVNITNLTVQNITMEWWEWAIVTWSWEYEETNLNVSTHTLTNTPISEKGFMVFVDSGTWLFPTTDYTYNSSTQTITFNTQLWVSEKAIIWVMVGSLGGSITIKPSDLESTNSPIDWYVAMKEPGSDEFTWVAGTWEWGITAYTIEDGTMDGTTPVVISDPRIELDTPFNIYYETEPAWNITRTLGAGTITLVSDDPADTMDFRLVIFWFGNKTTYIQSEVITLDGAWPRVISDSRISADTPVNLFPLQEPTGYLTIVAGAWEVTITSSASETNLEVRYIGFTELCWWQVWPIQTGLYARINMYS